MGLYRYLSFFYLSGALACYLSLMTYLFKSIAFENAHPQSQRATNNQQHPKGRSIKDLMKALGCATLMPYA